MLLLVMALAGACAGRSAPTLTPGTAEGAGVVGEPVSSSAPGSDSAAPAPAKEAGDGSAEEASADSGAALAAAPVENPHPLHGLCHQTVPAEGEPKADEARRKLAETVCVATLWLDGLLGGEPDVENARSVSGRLEITSLYSEADGFDPRVRLRVRYDLPTLEHRLSVFVGREDREDAVRGRQEPFAIRSSVFGIDNDEQWLAGLGYRPPGKWSERVDFKIGGNLNTAPEVYAQGRWRKNHFVGMDSVWRFRETVFWQNHDGFGLTSHADMDHVLRQNLLLRWANVGTVSEASDGLDWRSSFLLYHNLYRAQALAQEAFIRGSTKRDVPIREYGVRGVYRFPLKQRWLFGEVVLGYTWPRENLDELRKGSTILGIGVELLFGEDPY